MQTQQTGPTEVSSPKKKVTDSLWAFLVATALFGPLALPLLWRNPRYKVSTKVLGSIAVIVFTVFLLVFTKQALEPLLNQLTLP